MMQRTPRNSGPGYSRFLIAGVSLILGIGITACTTVPTATATTASTADHPPRTYQDSINLSGRIQVQYQQNNQPQNLPGSFEWQQNKDDTRISLISPLGQTIASISQTAAGATLQQANQPLRTAEDLDSLLSDALGWPLPVAGLRDWLQGYMRTPDGQRKMLPAQDDQMLNTDGWRIRYVSWQDEAGQARPKRIDLQRYTSRAGEVTMRIVIDQWKTP